MSWKEDQNVVSLLHIYTRRVLGTTRMWIIRVSYMHYKAWSEQKQIEINLISLLKAPNPAPPCRLALRHVCVVTIRSLSAPQGAYEVQPRLKDVGTSEWGRRLCDQVIIYSKRHSFASYTVRVQLCVYLKNVEVGCIAAIAIVYHLYTKYHTYFVHSAGLGFDVHGGKAILVKKNWIVTARSWLYALANPAKSRLSCGLLLW